MENNRIKILAIDDHPDNLISLKAILEDAFQNAVVFTALNGNDGVKIAFQENPDVVLLDIIMPGMDGFDVCSVFKSDPVLEIIPIVFLTALKDDKQSRIRCLEVGAEAFLSKPIDESELVAQIRAMLKIKAANFSKKYENEHLAALVAERTRELELTHVATLNLLEDLKRENDARRKTEEALSKSEALYRSILLASPDNTTVTDLNGIITISSPSGMNLLGFSSPDQIIGMHITDFLSTEDKVCAIDNMAKMIQGIYVGPHEYLLTGVNKQQVEAEINGEVIYDQDHKPTGFVFIIRDITERKIQERKIQESEALYKAILEASPDHITITDLNGNVLMASPSTYQTYHLDPDEDVTKLNIDSVFVPEDLERMKSDFGKLVQGNRTGPNEYKSVRRNGEIFDIEVKGGMIRDAAGTLKQLVFIARDITNRKIAEKLLQESEEKYRLIFEKSPLGFIYFDKEGKILDCNDYYSRIIGPSREQIIGVSLLDYESPGVVNLVKKCLAGVADIYEGKFTSQFADKISYIKAFITPIKLSDNTVQGGFIILEDISEQKRVNDQIKHISRLYAFLGQINQAVVRIDETTNLLKKICDVAVEFGEFKMAWIALLNEDNSQISNYIQSGDVDGYLDKVFPSLQEFTSNNGPTATAIKTGEMVCSNDIENEQLLKWKDEAISRGFKSLSSIPLKMNGKIIGTLNLYATETNFFNEDELGLLSEIADDISYALSAIEANKLRKQVENNLIESENRYNTFINNNLDLIFVKDENLRYLVLNDAMADFFAKTKEEILGKTDNELASGNLIAPCSTSDIKALESDGLVLQIEQLGGKMYEITKFRMKLGNGKYGVGGILHDITVRRKAQLALEESRTELQAIYDNAPVMMCVVDENFKILYSNGEFSSFVHLSGDDFKDGIIGDVVGCIESCDTSKGCGYGRKCNECSLRNALKKTLLLGENQQNIEYHSTVVMQGEKRVVDLLGSTALIKSNGQDRILLCLFDITERKNAENALQKSEMILRTFIENAPFNIWARDVNSVGILENHSMVETFGSILGKTPLNDSNIHPDLAVKFVAQNDRVFAGEIIEEESYFTIRGKKLYFQLIVFPIYLNEEIIGIAGFNIDITERKKQQEALQQYQIQLKNFAAHIQNVREEERILLAREIHDDLAQILVAVKIDIGILKNKLPLNLHPAASREFIDEFSKVSDLVNNTIKTTRRIIADLRPEVLDELGLVEAMKHQAMQFSDRYHVVCDFITDLSDVNLDSQTSLTLFRIQQESLNNIAKHAKATKVLIKFTKGKNRLLLEISDNGVGFNASKREKTDSYGLIGMRERAFLADAELRIESEPGKGTKVSVELPLNDK